MLRARDLPHEVAQARAALVASGSSVPDDLSAMERTKVWEILRREHGNKTRAASVLGIDRRKLYRLIAKYGLPPGEATERAG
jgi:DNA-binding NtrC family response regulator